MIISEYMTYMVVSIHRACALRISGGFRLWGHCLIYVRNQWKSKRVVLILTCTDGGAEHLKPVNVKIAQLREALEAVSAEQIYLRARDYRHRISEFLLTSFYTLFCTGTSCS